MPRIIITVSDKMDEVLKAQSERTAAPVAALVRQAIEEWARHRGIPLEDTVSWGGSRSVHEDNEYKTPDVDTEPVAVAPAS